MTDLINLSISICKPDLVTIMQAKKEGSYNLTIAVVATILCIGVYVYGESINHLLFDNDIFQSEEAMKIWNFIGRIQLAVNNFEASLIHLEKVELDYGKPSSFKESLGELSSDIDFIMSSVDQIAISDKNQQVYARIRKKRKELAEKCCALSARLDNLLARFQT